MIAFRDFSSTQLFYAGLLMGFSMGFWDEEEAQVSAELLILMAALVALALLLVSQLQATAEKGKDLLAKNADAVFKEIGSIK